MLRSRLPRKIVPFTRWTRSACRCCQWRRDFVTSTLRAAEPARSGGSAPSDTNNTIAKAPIHAPRSYGKSVEDDFEPYPLPRPIGMPLPPRVGDNTGIDHRSLKQRKDDFVDRDKHLQRRRELTAQISKPYFREWRNLRYHQGKSFIASPRLFRADHSLFFPNLYGETLLKSDKTPRDTTPLLEGKASIVSIFSNQWAEGQVRSFISKKANPALYETMASEGDAAAQLVYINYEENAGKAWLIRLFRYSLRKQHPEKDWGKYFLVRRGITDEMREYCGLLNSKVGYIFLVDQHCRIRWAGSGQSQTEERASLAAGFAKLVAETRRVTASPGTLSD